MKEKQLLLVNIILLYFCDLLPQVLLTPINTIQVSSTEASKLNSSGKGCKDIDIYKFDR